MKDNLENILKDKLDNFELPYDASAWNAMQTKLDAKVNTPSNSKWYWAGGAVLIATLSSLLVYTWNGEINSKNEKNLAENTLQQTSTPEENENIVSPLPEEKDEEAPTDDVVEENDNIKIEVLSETETSTRKNKEIKSVPSINTEGEKQVNDSKKENLGEQKEKENDNTPTENKNYYAIGLVNNTQICYGGDLVIKNTETNKIVRARVNGKTIELLQNEQVKISDQTSSTRVDFLNDNDEVIGSTNILVHNKVSLEFNAEGNLFNIDNGLSVIQISNINQNVDGYWKLDGKLVELNENNEIYNYEKGVHTISFTAKDKNGCEFTEENQVRIDKKYQLLAENSFVPSSLERSNQTFMPYALTQLNVAFKLVILDPRTGALIYETNDASKAWDGRDMRTGNMVEINQTFVWQVQLLQSVENAPMNYRGTVTVASP